MGDLLQSLTNWIWNYRLSQQYFLDDRPFFQQIPDIVRQSPILVLLILIDLILMPLLIIKFRKAEKEKKEFKIGATYVYFFFALISFNFLIFQLIEGLRSYYSRQHLPIGSPVGYFLFPGGYFLFFLVVSLYFLSKRLKKKR